jgi:hypothetical protein
MDGSPRSLAPALPVVRGFAGTRLESQLLASAYDRLLPGSRYSRPTAQDIDTALVADPWPSPETIGTDELTPSRIGT